MKVASLFIALGTTFLTSTGYAQGAMSKLSSPVAQQRSLDTSASSRLNPSLQGLLSAGQEGFEIKDSHRKLIETYLAKPDQYSRQKAVQGGVGDGGGDPRAQQVLNFGIRAIGWLYSNANSKFAINHFDLSARIEYLSLSLDFKQPLLRMTKSSELNCFGESKIGCTYSDASVNISGFWWDQSTTSEMDKCVVSLIELLRPQSLRKVYEVSAQLCNQLLAPVPAQTVAVDACDAPTKRLFATMSACVRDYSARSCLDQWWVPYAKSHGSCAEINIGFCLRQCTYDNSSGQCAEYCNKDI